jgi:hypothetical protein
MVTLSSPKVDARKESSKSPDETGSRRAKVVILVVTLKAREI